MVERALGFLIISLLSTFISSSFAEEFASGKVIASSRDVMIPKNLKTLIENEYIRQYRVNVSSKDVPEQEILDKMKRVLLEIGVEVKDSANHVVREPVRFVLPSGGGTIDLADYVAARKGAFKIQILFKDLSQDLMKALKIFYVSNARSRSLDSETLGSGCGKYFDVTGYLRDTLIGKGLRVHSTDARYVSLLAGTFFFVIPFKEQLFLGSLSIKDSRYSELTCGD